MELVIDGYTTLIDEDDYERIMQYKWKIRKSKAEEGYFYFRACLRKVKGKQQMITLHRFIMRCTPDETRDVDHINRNTLDNRKCNLRFATKSENMRNRLENY